jgi:hypothetical protein
MYVPSPYLNLVLTKLIHTNSSKPFASSTLSVAIYISDLFSICNLVVSITLSY